MQVFFLRFFPCRHNSRLSGFMQIQINRLFIFL